MLPNEINTKLAAKGYTATLIAEALSVKPASVSAVINEVSDSKRIAKAVATVLDLPIEEVFPNKPQYHDGYSRKAIRQQKVISLRQQLAS